MRSRVAVRSALDRVAVAALVFAVVVGASPSPATAQSAPAGAPPAQLGPQVTILAQPTTVGPSDPFTVFVGIERAPTAVELAVDIYERAAPGDDLGAEPADDPVATFEPIALPDAEGIDARTSAFTIELFRTGEANPSPAWGHRIDQAGVYPVRLRLRDENQDLLATTMTALLRLPDDADAEGAPEPVDAALLVRIHRPPPADADERATATVAEPRLLAELGPVLDRFADHPDLPATFSVTPDTAARLAADPAAASVLDRLRDELEPADRTLLDAPYVRIDPTELVAGDLADELTRQRDLGRQTLSELLEPPVSGTWPLTGTVDEATLAALRTRGIFRVLLPDAAVRTDAGRTAPVDLPAGDGVVRALAIEDGLAIGRAAPADPVLAAHRLLARLAVFATPTPEAASSDPASGRQRIVTVDPSIAPPETLDLVLSALATGTPFFRATTVDAALSAPVATGSPRLAPPADSEIEPLVAAIGDAEVALASYRAMVSGRNEATRPFERTLAISAATDLAFDQRLDDASSVTDDLQVPFGAISIPERDTITLATRDGQFPVPISSSADQELAVVVTVEASDRVEFPTDRIEVTLRSDRQEVPIGVRTRGLGDTPVRISVTSPDGGVVLAEGQYTIRSTAVSGVGIVLTVGAGAFLVVWWGRHWHRNRGTARHARRRPRRPAPPDATAV